MKKILIILMTFLGIGMMEAQTDPVDVVNRLMVKGLSEYQNPLDSSARVLMQDSISKELHWVSLSNLPANNDFVTSGSTINKNLVLTIPNQTNPIINLGSMFEIDASGFDGNLTTDDNTLEEVAQKFDDFTVNVGTGLQNIVEDTTPELGGDLDVNGNSVTSLSNLDFFLDTNGDGTNQINRAFRIYNQNTSAENHLMQVYKSSINTVVRAFTSFGNDGDLAAYLTLHGDGLDTGAQIQLSNSNNEDDVVGAWVFTANANLEFGTQTTTALSIDDSTLALTVPSTTNADITSLGNKALITKEYADANYSGSTQRTDESIQDMIGNTFFNFSSPNSILTGAYIDISNQYSFILDDDLSLYDNTTSGFLTNSDVTDFVDKSSIETIGGIKTFTGPTDFEAGIVVEGTVVMRKSGNANQTVLDIVNPTQNNNINFQNGSGTVAFLSDITGGGSNINASNTQVLFADANGDADGSINFTWDGLNLFLDGNLGIGTETPTEKIEVSGKVKADGFDANTNKITNLSDGTLSTDAVNKSQLDAVANSIPSNEITNVVVSDTTYTFVEADILASKQHYFTAPVTTDTIVLSIPEITHTSGNSIFILARATNDVPIKILDSINSQQYINKTLNEVVSLSSYQDDVWITHSNLNASAYTPPSGGGGGSNFILNGTHDNSNNITIEAEWTISGGVANFPDNGVAGGIIYDLDGSITEGTNYTLTFDLVGATGSGRFALDGYSPNVGQYREFQGNNNYSTGQVSIPFTVGSGDTAYTEIRVRASSASPSAFTIDNLVLTAD